MSVIKRYFHAELEDPGHYDLVINTEHLSFEGVNSLRVFSRNAIRSILNLQLELTTSAD